MEPMRGPIRAPVVMRSRLMLEVASELVAFPAWSQKQVRIDLREQGAETWGVALFASDAPEAIYQVARGEVHFGICNPGAVLAMALRGSGPFQEPIPVRAITVLPQFDQLGFAAASGTGLQSLGDLGDRHYPLRLSLRGQRDHSVHLIVDQVFSTYGFSIDDITAWGGQVRYDPGLPHPSRLDAVERGEVDAIFDEALPNNWARRAMELGMRFLAVDEPNLQQLEAMGFRRVAITRAEYPALPEDVWTVDFSGWPVYTVESTPDDIVAAFCAALEARKDRIPWYGQGPFPLDRLCRDTRDGPLPIPLHPAAERFWRERGYLP